MSEINQLNFSVHANMKHIPVTSSNIQSLAYDKDKHILHVRFKNQSTYEYVGVTHDEIADLAQAPSVGGHLNKFIKGKYEGRKL